MKKTAIRLLTFICVLMAATPVSAQFNLKKAANAVSKGVQAATLTDAQMAAYVKEFDKKGRIIRNFQKSGGHFVCFLISAANENDQTLLFLSAASE